MATSQIEPERCRTLNEDPSNEDGNYVLYWMQASMRGEHNPALERAVQIANDHAVPLVVVCTVITDYPEASARHFTFMLTGMGQALRAIERRGATVVVRSGSDPASSVVRLATEAVEVVVDRGYLRHQRVWRSVVADQVSCLVTCVEGDVLVPIDEVSDKQESAARTIRPRIEKRMQDFIVALDTTALVETSGVRLASDVQLDEFGDIEKLMGRLGLDNDGEGPQPVDWITPGTAAARSLLDDFADRLSSYEDDRNRWASKNSSMMSPYLHFGQISPVFIAQRLQGLDGADDEYLDELIVRRELACNYVEQCTDYDSFAGLPEWARTSLERHAHDVREVTYTSAEMEAGETDDDVWNAIMAEIRERGWVHNQLRITGESRSCGGPTRRNMRTAPCSTSTTDGSSTAAIRRRTRTSDGASGFTTRASWSVRSRASSDRSRRRR